MAARVGIDGLVRPREEAGEVVALDPLGAQRGDVLRLILTQGFRLVATGTLIGLATATLLARVIERLLYGVQPLHSVAFISSAAILFAVAFLASLTPARKAASIQPMEALRCE